MVSENGQSSPGPPSTLSCRGTEEERATRSAKFRERDEEIAEFALDVAESGLSDQYGIWAYDFAIIRLYGEFEKLMLEALVVAIKNDTATIAAHRPRLPEAPN